MSGRNRDPYDVGTEGILNLSFVVLCAECLLGKIQQSSVTQGWQTFTAAGRVGDIFQLSATTVKAAVDNA